MFAAIYARKSTEQNVADEAKSVTRQIDNATAYAIRKGWTVTQDYIFQDDGISGAEFAKRPGLTHLRSFLGSGRAPFHVLVVADNSRLGREASETAYLIKQLDEAGVEVWSYLDNRSLTPRDAIGKLISSVQGFSDEDHREKSSKKGHEAHTRLVQQAKVTGGRVYGYRNVDVHKGVDSQGRPIRSHVERVIHEPEAEVIRRIFRLYGIDAHGLKHIAKTLTREGVPPPTPFIQKDTTKPQPVKGWATDTVRSILKRDLYHGVIVWNKSKKRTSWGKVQQRRRPQSEWISVPAEHLRIVPEELWQRVASIRQEYESQTLRFFDGRLAGRPPKHGVTNLLAGLSTCGICGGGLIVETSHRKNGPRVPEYICFRRRKNGGCTNTLHPRVEEVNEAVLFALEAHALTPEAIEQVIQFTERDDIKDRQIALDKQQARLEKQRTNIVDAIALGGDIPALVSGLKEVESQIKALQVESAALRPVPRLPQSVIEDRLAEWRRMLRGTTTQGRSVIQRIVHGRIVFTPRPADSPFGPGYDFAAPTRFDKLFAGVVTPHPGRPVSTYGTEGIGPEDTHDADYGRLLERVVASTAARKNESVRESIGVPTGIRTRVLALKGPRPRPLDDGDA